MKSETFFLLGSIGLAFSLFQSFEPFVTFCNFIKPFVEGWRLILYGAWNHFFGLIGIELSTATMDMINLVVFTLVGILRFASLRHFTSDAQMKFHFYNEDFWSRSYVVWATIVIVIILVPSIFSNVEISLTESKNILVSQTNSASVFFKLFIAFSVIALGVAHVLFDLSRELELISINLSKSVSKYFFRAVGVFVILNAINFVGLYAEYKHILA